MRLGLGPIDLAHTKRADLQALAGAAVAAGFDAIWVAESRADGVGGGLAAATLLSQVVPIRVGAAIDFGESHPMYTAEDIAVADIASQGRIEVLLRGGSEEQVRLLVEALGGAHLRFEGPTLRVPARLEANEPVPDAIALNPRPVQPAVPLWVEGTEAVRWQKGVAVPRTSNRLPPMLLCSVDVAAEDLLAATGGASTYFLVDATTPQEVAEAGHRLVGPLRMPAFPDWVLHQ